MIISIFRGVDLNGFTWSYQPHFFSPGHRWLVKGKITEADALRSTSRRTLIADKDDVRLMVFSNLMALTRWSCSAITFKGFQPLAKHWCGNFSQKWTPTIGGKQPCKKKQDAIMDPWIAF